MSKIHTECVGGFWITERQEQILSHFAGRYHGERTRVEWTIDSHGRCSWVYDNRSNTESVLRALAKRGLFTITEDNYVPRGYSHAIKRETFTLVPAVAGHFDAVRAASAARAAARTAERDAEYAKRDAREKAAKRDGAARALAVEALIRNHPIAFEDHLAAAYRAVDGNQIAPTNV